MGVEDDGRRPAHQDLGKPETAYPRREHHHRTRRAARWPPGSRWDPYDKALTLAHDELLLRRLVAVEADLRAIAGGCGSAEQAVGEAVARAAAEVEAAREAVLHRRPSRRAELEAVLEGALRQAEERLGYAFRRLR